MASRVTGLNEYRLALSRLSVAIINGVQDDMEITAESIRTAVVGDIRMRDAPPINAPATPPAGIQRRPVPTPPRRSAPDSGALTSKRGHIPSKPHSPPNADTGRLMGSYETTWSADRTVIYIGSPVRYSAWLENGTSRMLPRPHLVPRYRQALPGLSGRIKRRLARMSRP